MLPIVDWIINIPSNREIEIAEKSGAIEWIMKTLLRCEKPEDTDRIYKGRYFAELLQSMATVSVSLAMENR